VAKDINACAHSHSMSGGSIWAFCEGQCCFWIARGLVSYLTMWLLILKLFKNSIDTQQKLRLNLHSLSVSELLEYGHKTPKSTGYVEGMMNDVMFVWERQKIQIQAKSCNRNDRHF
jgi:hypothetical protein